MKTTSTKRKDQQPEVIAAFREWYMAQLEGLAEELRPQLGAGKLRGWRDGDGEREAAAEQAGRPWRPPLFRLQELVARRLCPTAAAAHVLLAVSPSAEAIGEGWHGGTGAAGVAAARDLLILAAARGWYAPAAGEEGAEELIREALRFRCSARAA